MLDTTLDQHAMANQSDLKATFGLTDAEMRLARRLVAGETLRKAASTLGVTYETARTTLKAVFRKTHTRRQVELVLLLGQTERTASIARVERAMRSRR